VRALQLLRAGEPLSLVDLPRPVPGAGEVLVRVRACGVCRTDLHILDGDLREPALPLVPGHQIVGVVEQCGADVSELTAGQRVGIPWLGATCGRCDYCLSGAENLCESARFTGYHRDGGYAEFALADADHCLPIPDAYSDERAAPLLCAGLIGYRSLRRAGSGQRLGLYGFGASAHIVAQLARHEGRSVYAFTRAGDDRRQAFARELGCCWSGGSEERPPELLDAAIVFAPVGSLVPTALESVRRGGTVVCAGIHMSDIPTFPYSLLWGERSLCSVANLTRADGREFFALAPQVPVHTEVETFPLEQASRALEELRAGSVRGAAVLVVAADA
jgi:propanol-preferring alcohol dehydrogenase